MSVKEEAKKTVPVPAWLTWLASAIVVGGGGTGVYATTQQDKPRPLAVEDRARLDEVTARLTALDKTVALAAQTSRETADDVRRLSDAVQRNDARLDDLASQVQRIDLEGSKVWRETGRRPR